MAWWPLHLLIAVIVASIELYSFHKLYKQAENSIDGYTIEYIQEETATIPGLDGRKMSKSYGNQIPLFCDEATLKKLIGSIKTDSSLPTEPKSTNCALFDFYKLFATKEQTNAFAEKFAKGISWADAKKELFEIANAYLSPMREKYNYYMNHYDEVEKILAEGSKKARVIAKETIARARKAVGLD